jgi:acid phosphatase (class A)
LNLKERRVRLSSFVRAGLPVVGALALAGAAGAQPQPAPAKPPPQLRFVAASDLQPQVLLAPPPAAGSPLAAAELAEVRRTAAAATKAEWDRAKWDNDHEDATMFAPVFGAGFDLKALPATAKLMSEVRHDEAIAATLAKNYFKRTRPWLIDTSVRTCSRDEAPQSSYPSGHTTMGFAMAVVLAHAAPALGPQLLARAREYARERIVCGMHFRSDIVAGETLGTAVAVMMLRNPDFQADVAAARAELQAAHLAPA